MMNDDNPPGAVRRPILVVMIVAQIMDLIASTIVNVGGWVCCGRTSRAPTLPGCSAFSGPSSASPASSGRSSVAPSIEANPFGLGWRSGFLINVPVGLACLVVARRFLPHRAGDRSISIDIPGAIQLMASSVLFVLPLGRSAGWGTSAWACLSGSESTHA